VTADGDRDGRKGVAADAAAPTDDAAARLAAHLSDWIASQVRASGGRGVVFGLSGGLDSAVVAGLAVRAFPDDCLGVIMPCHSDPADAADAALAAAALGVPTATVDLSPAYDALMAALAVAAPQAAGDRLVAANLKPRLRMATLYAFANLRGYRVLGTGNRCELTIGYFTKHGDGAADLLPLGSLVKGEVRALGRHLGVPERILAKTPSAGLWVGQTDEGEMGLTYEDLDRYLLTGEAAPAVKARVEALRAASEHKRRLPPVAPKPGA
jgi:NAD+ synthase